MPVTRLPVTRLGAGTSMLAVAVAISALPQAFAAAPCEARSGPSVMAVVELFTSEGCDSCPPADRWLTANFPASADPAAAVALAYHVDYWDRLGWKDRFADPRFTARQEAAAKVNGGRFVYTPQVLVQGRPEDWRAGDALAAVTTAQARTAKAQITLAQDVVAGEVRARAVAKVAASSPPRAARLTLVYADSGLTSQVTRGENKGARLAHDHVVRSRHQGPDRSGGGELTLEHTFSRPHEAGTYPRIVAILEDAASGAVLQALAAPVCGER